VHEIQTNYQGPTHVLEHKGLWRRCAYFYRQVLIFQKEGDVAGFCIKCGTNVPRQSSSRFSTLRQSKWKENIWQNPELSGVCCSRHKEFRERVRKASKDRGFRSEQAFILAACEREIRRGDDNESVTQFEARIAATLTNLAEAGATSSNARRGAGRHNGRCS